jgi:hypothetical protein
MLTAKDVEFYKAQGYVVARDVLSAAELERLLRCLSLACAV